MLKLVWDYLFPEDRIFFPFDVSYPSWKVIHMNFWKPCRSST
uniref:Uncharacterized protein n=1 Tax=Rhizophora mucronata TaxID=61149 RepID=A0A2P2MTI7_RHIMU